MLLPSLNIFLKSVINDFALSFFMTYPFSFIK